MSDQTPGTPQTPPTPPTQPPAAPVDPAAPAPAQPAAPPPAAPPAQAAPPPAAASPAAVPPAAAQPPVPPPAAPAAAPPAPAQPAAPYVPPPAPTAYPAAPGAPGGPGYGTTAGAPPPAGGYFKSGKGKTIALIVGGVVAVGVIGGVAALLAGGGDGKDEVTTTAAGPQGSGVLDPEPVENTDPAPDPAEPTEPAPDPTEPAPEPTEPAPEPTEPAPDPEPQPAGDSVVIGGNIAVPVLSGWEVFGSDESAVAMGSGNDFVYAVTGTVKPSTDAGQLLSEELRTMLPAESYPDLATSDISPAEPGGSIVSLAFIEYEATWTDGQGTVPVHGVIASAVRQDGTALLILAEHTPPKEFADIYEQALAPIVGGALSSMAGAS